jgi:tetratricopeptide (TPR) repeat protein
LARLGSDSLEGPSAAAVAEHIEECPNCQSRLERLVENDRAAGPSLPPTDNSLEIPGFVIERELGRGSMSVVYQALQPSLNRRVALKVVRSGPAAGSHDHERWLHEARACSRVRHPNVVPLYDAGEANGWLYLVLEIVPGGTLDRQLEVPYTGKDAAALVKTIAEAVAAIHSAGLLHLDLKPSNILLDGVPGTSREQAIPRVADFGIAFRWNDPDATIPGAGPLGTPWYMAPEQVAGDHTAIGPEADVYGLGALLYHVLTGRPPFAAPSVAQTLEQVRGQEPVPPRRLNPAVPRDLQTICLKCLQKDPIRRYPSAQALADDLRRCLDGRPIAARPASMLENTWKNCRRRPAVAGLAAALAITLAASFASVLFLWRQAVRERHRAEADFESASEVLSQLVDLTTDERNALWSFDPTRMTSLVEQSRERLRELAARRPDDSEIARQLAAVNYRLHELLVEQGKWAEAKAVIEESLRDLERIASQAQPDHWASLWRIRHVSRLAVIANHDGKNTERIDLLQEAVHLAEELARHVRTAYTTTVLVQRRSALATALAENGDCDRARVLATANCDLLDLIPRDSDDDRLVAARVLARLELSRLKPEGKLLAVARSPSDLDRTDPLATLASEQCDRLPARAWAELVLEAIRQQAGVATDRALPDNAAYLVCTALSTSAAEFRRLCNLDAARQTADRKFAVSRLLVERNPDKAAAHLALADAYDQFAKNAWRIPDRAAIDRNLELALRATQRALELDPNNEAAAFQLHRRQQKLNDLRGPR